MKRRIRCLIMFVICVPALAACTGGSVGGVTATPTPGIAGHSLDVATRHCSSLQWERLANILGGYIEGEETPTSSPPGGLAPTSERVKAEVDRLRTRLNELQEPYGGPNAREAAHKELMEYLKGLVGKRVVGWQGWAICAGSGGVTVVVDDPYAVTPASETPALTPASDPLERKRYGLPPYVLVVKPDPADVGQTLYVGQRVSISGIITDVPDVPEGEPLIRGKSVNISSAKITPVERITPLAPVAPDLMGAIVALERGACFGTCPIYQVTVYGDGTVVFEGRANTRVLGFRMATIGEAQVRQLIAEFNKANFFSLNNYIDHAGTDAPSATTFLTLQGNSKMVEHDYADGSAPKELRLLEQRIDEILNTAQWTGRDR